ncbi:MAG: EF-hand domain-containing protein [Candidatus Margulisbacteria bacterium]|nr:EF-hand domain-containing protein [Candidatus Margulisiibacteriota bacterium]
MVNDISSSASDMAARMWSQMLKNDTDGDSKLSRTEMEQMAANMPASKSGEGPGMDQMFAEADTDGDGSISKDEFASMMKNHKPPEGAGGKGGPGGEGGVQGGASAATSSKSLSKAFSAIDTNQDGKISQQELEAYLLKQLEKSQNDGTSSATSSANLDTESDNDDTGSSTLTVTA